MTPSAQKKTTVLIVNDFLVLTAVIRATVETQPDLQVIATALNGEEATLQVARHHPDLVLMDIHMPKMNGVEATRRIILKRPETRILITSATITRNMRHIFEALEYGAADYARSPSLNFAPGTAVSDRQLQLGGAATLNKIRTTLKISNAKLAQQHQPKPATPTTPPSFPSPNMRRHLLAIGASTGGPTTIATILQRLKHPFPAPIIICLHMDAEFTQGFLSWLSDQTGFSCTIARNQMRPENNHVYIAPGGKNNLELDSRGRFQITPPQPGQYFFPNISHLFSSIAKNIGTSACGVVLTGMGDDGAEGLKQIQQKGGLVLAQDDQSSAIDSMSRKARMATQQDRGYPPAQMATQINSRF